VDSHLFLPPLVRAACTNTAAHACRRVEEHVQSVQLSSHTLFGGRRCFYRLVRYIYSLSLSRSLCRSLSFPLLDADVSVGGWFQAHTTRPLTVSFALPRRVRYDLDPSLAQPFGMNAEQSRGDIYDELPFAMDDTDELDTYVQKLTVTPQLNMFASRRQDITESIHSLDHDLQASIADRKKFAVATDRRS
jgi:hypothetical protein